ncbi:MAG TPA: TatD family hydrolase [Vicinamibacterales bacterium]|nr:TatD family hydrolase [Vicinamibacterales bacterium]
MIDSHCHLADEAFTADLQAVVDRATAAGLTGAMCILSAGDEAELSAAERIVATWPAVRFSTGVHPHNAGAFAGRVGEVHGVVARSIDRVSAKAIGEIGLDYHYDFSPRDVQREVFAAQLALARERSLPIVIHTREATADTFAILREVGTGVRGVFHCFTGDRAMAAAALDLGFYISLAGIVTFPKAEELREVARAVPADRLLVETDAPYLAPVPFRGKRNEPAFVARTVDAIASARGVAAADLARQTAGNFAALLGPTVSLQTA